MKTSELRLSWVLGRGYGDAFFKADNLDLPEALKELGKTLREKYGYEPLQAIGIPVPGLPLDGSGPAKFFLMEWDYDRREDVLAYCRLKEYARAHPEACGIEQDSDAEWPAPQGKVICGRRVVYWLRVEDENE